MIQKNLFKSPKPTFGIEEILQDKWNYNKKM